MSTSPWLSQTRIEHHRPSIYQPRRTRTRIGSICERPQGKWEGVPQCIAVYSGLAHLLQALVRAINHLSPSSLARFAVRPITNSRSKKLLNASVIPDSCLAQLSGKAVFRATSPHEQVSVLIALCSIAFHMLLNARPHTHVATVALGLAARVSIPPRGLSFFDSRSEIRSDISQDTARTAKNLMTGLQGPWKTHLPGLKTKNLMTGLQGPWKTHLPGLKTQGCTARTANPFDQSQNN